MVFSSFYNKKSVKCGLHFVFVFYTFQNDLLLLQALWGMSQPADILKSTLFINLVTDEMEMEDDDAIQGYLSKGV